MVKIWAEENKTNNLSITIINPGKTRTKMRLKAMPGEIQETLPSTNFIAKKIINLIFLDKKQKNITVNINDI